MAAVPKSGGLFAAAVVAAGASMWGLYWVPLRAAEEIGAAGPWAVVLFNLPALLVSLLIWLWFSRRPEGRLGPVLLAGLFAGLGLALYAAGLVYSSVVRVTLLFYLTPVWSTLLAMAFLGERTGLKRWASLGLGLVGLFLVLGGSPGDISVGFGLGEALGLLSGVSWAAAAVMIRGGLNSGVTPWVFVQYIVVVATAAAIGAAMGETTPDLTLAWEVTLSWIAVFSVVIMVSIYAIFWALERMSPGRAGLLMMTEVVVAVISAAIFLPEETMSPVEWTGAALIVGAGVLEVFGDEA